MLRIETNKWPTEFVDPHFDGFWWVLNSVDSELSNSTPDTLGTMGTKTDKKPVGDPKCSPMGNSLCFLVAQGIGNVILKNTPEMKTEQQ